MFLYFINIKCIYFIVGLYKTLCQLNRVKMLRFIFKTLNYELQINYDSDFYHIFLN